MDSCDERRRVRPTDQAALIRTKRFGSRTVSAVPTGATKEKSTPYPETPSTDLFFHTATDALLYGGKSEKRRIAENQPAS